MPRYTIDNVLEVWDNDTSTMYRVSPDADGLDLVSVSMDGDEVLCLEPEAAEIVAKGMLDTAARLRVKVAEEEARL